MNIASVNSVSDAQLYIQHLIDTEQWDTLNRIYDQIQYDNKYNKISQFKPYPFQLKMFNAGKDYMSRFACLANRCGKTFSGAREMAWHLTGLYPDYWEGHRFNKPIRAWAIGITSDSTRKILQLETMGTLDIRDSDNIGTASIPRDCIIIDSIEKDGPAAKIARIRHYDADGNEDGVSILEFRSTQQGHMALAGAAVDFIWIDEEDEHDSLEIFSQARTRLATTNGKMLITATPEHGVSPLIQRFYNRSNLFIFHAGWEDAPHLTEEVKAELIAGYDEFEIEMRTKGLPSKGSGAVFKVDDEDITVEPFTIPEDWNICWGVDFGRSRDPSTIVGVAFDPNNEIAYIFEEHYLDKDRSQEAMAHCIMNSNYSNAPVIIPHDGQSIANDGGDETRAAILRKHGCNVMRDSFSNPPEVQNRIANIRKKHMGKVGGLEWMNFMMKQGKLKVFSTCHKFFEEKRGYFYIEKGGKSIPRDKDDHVIDASRMAVLSVERFGLPAYECFSGYEGSSYQEQAAWAY